MEYGLIVHAAVILMRSFGVPREAWGPFDLLCFGGGMVGRRRLTTSSR